MYLYYSCSTNVSTRTITHEYNGIFFYLLSSSLYRYKKQTTRSKPSKYRYAEDVLEFFLYMDTRENIAVAQ